MKFPLEDRKSLKTKIRRHGGMKYETILAMPDSKEKLLKLERKLLRLQHHGADFFKAKEEWRRLFNIYRKREG